MTNIIDTIGESHTSEYSFNVLKTEARKCENEWGVRVTSVVTDTASNMSHLRQYLSKPLIHAYDYQAHAINLVAKDASGTAKPLISKVNSNLKHLRNHHADSAELKNAKMPILPLPVYTRWKPLTDSLE